MYYVLCIMYVFYMIMSIMETISMNKFKSYFYLNKNDDWFLKYIIYTSISMNHHTFNRKKTFYDS